MCIRDRIIAAQLAWPELNFGIPWLSYGRLRPLHTNAVIFAFGGCALIGTSYYVVQRTCQTKLFMPKLEMCIRDRGMAITFIVSSAGTFDPTGPLGAEVFFDSLTMFVFFLLTGRWLEMRLRDRTAGALEALTNRLPDTVLRLLPDGRQERVAIRRLAVGDTVLLFPGEAFPADGTVMELSLIHI